MGNTASAFDIHAALQAALADHQEGRLAAAEAVYRQILSLQPNNFSALNLLGILAHQTGHNEQAIAIIGRAVTLDPSNMAAHHYLGEAYRALNRLDEAVPCLQEALRLKPDHVDTYNALGCALNSLGRFDDALVCFQKALALNPKAAEVHNNIGCALNDQGRLDEAVAHFQKALALNPKSAEAHNNLGNVFKNKAQHDQAMDCYQKALILKPDFAEAYNNAGCALNDLGRFSESPAYFEKAWKLKPAYTAAYANNSTAQIALGQYTTALESLRHAFRTGETTQLRNIFSQIVSRIHPLQDDAEIRSLLTRALSEAWGRPSDLCQSAIAFIKLNRAAGECIEKANAAWPARLNEQCLFGPSGLLSTSSDPLLLRLLETTPVSTLEMERFLTAVRYVMLQSATNGAVPEADALNLYCALARQCFLNEYIFSYTAEEMEQATLLRDKLVTSLASGNATPLLWLIAASAYFPLHTLPHAEELLRQSWPDPVIALLTQQVKEPLAELKSRSTIPQLTSIEDSVSLLVQQQYEENPYPRWEKVPTASGRLSVDSYFRAIFPSVNFQPHGKNDRVDVLVAGCGTGQQSIASAIRWNNAQVLAIDLSLSSLSYARRKTDELGIKNILYAQADIMKLHEVDRTFDIIESNGVLHHLADPAAGLENLLSLLKPGGFINLGLYSAAARQNIVAARQFIAEQGYTAQAQDIRHCRETLISKMETHPLLEKLKIFRDLFSTSECRDLLFHVQEHRFTLPQIKKLLETANLDFMGFVTTPLTSKKYLERFPEDVPMQNLDFWNVFETENPDTFSAMYQFWAQKPLNA